MGSNKKTDEDKVEEMSDTVSPAEEGGKPSAKEEWGDLFRTAIIAVIIALVIRTFAYEPFNIPSSSMRPTLLVGDYLFVSKFEYGYSRHSFPFGLGGFDGRIMMKMPQRGDIIVFKLPSNTSVDYIKRVVALPGETVQVIGGRLYINDERVEREPVGVSDYKGDYGSGVTVKVQHYIETLPGGIMHDIYEVSDTDRLDNTEKFRVPEGHVFVMGDNRDNSQDSRVQSQVGYVPVENIVGKADRIFFSNNGTAKIFEIWKWPFSIRYSRMFDKIGPVRPTEEKAEEQPPMEYKNFIASLGLEDVDYDLVKQALTHSSTGTADYERLEFLGDRVLGLAIAEELYKRFPEEKEGDLAKRHAALVSGKTLSKVAQHLKVGDILVLSENERQSGGHQNDNILSDAVEAVIGAVFLSSNYKTCYDLIIRLWNDYIDTMVVPPQDPKTQLQEWSQGRALGIPRYDLVERSGPDHQPVFRVSVSVDGYEAAVAEAGSKRSAEKAAAAAFLKINNLTEDA